MTKRIIVTRVEVLAAQGLIELAQMGHGEVTGKIRAIAAGEWVRGTEDDYLVTYDPEASQAS